MGPLKPWPLPWTLSALGLLWGRAVASSNHCATHSVYIACPLGIYFLLPRFGLCKRALCPLCLKNCWGLCWCNFASSWCGRFSTPCVRLSFKKKWLAAICSGRASSPCLPLVRLVSATCPPCVVGFGRASSSSPPLVRLVLLAVPASPVLVRHLSAMCPPLVRLVLLAVAAPPVLVRHLSAMCPPLVHHVSLAQTLSTMCPPYDRLEPCVRLEPALAAMCPLKPCLWTVSTL